MLFGGDSNLGGLSGYLPEEGGRTIFTTGSRIVASDVVGSDVVELDEMCPEDATSHLEQSLIRKDAMRNSPGQVKKPLTVTENLPLAITQAAAYLNKNQISIAKYLELLRGNQDDLVSLLSREFQNKRWYRGERNTVATTWLLSFEQMRKSKEAAAVLLSFISHLQPKNIPLSLLPPIGSEGEMTDAIGTLCAYSFLSSRGNNEIFDMQSLVHLATRIWVEQDMRAVKGRYLGGLDHGPRKLELLDRALACSDNQAGEDADAELALRTVEEVEMIFDAFVNLHRGCGKCRRCEELGMCLSGKMDGKIRASKVLQEAVKHARHICKEGMTTVDEHLDNSRQL
ncbi:hypothetical protein B0T14DRAFT_567951 [Immersiella caudata]|uniref:Uncharacterized protein n=1 Tax=Immersiella caudata TaxID=314043 RepID=A0AA39WJ42_9PEZI|nr:hypothetical protein B0T14DRAFT_567951 [Immersiella caudata]